MANRKAEVDAAVADVDFTAKNYQIEFETTLGRIRLDLLADVAPGHCRSFIGLTKIGYYDGIIFHRVIKGFMNQAGCPEGTGTGGPGYTVDAEFNDIKHEAGILSAARTSDPNSAGSQFFLCTATVPHLDGKYTVYGKTADEESLAVAMKIAQVETNANDRPLEDVTIKSARVIESDKN